MNNPFRLVTKQDLKDFYNKIKPYLGYEEMEDSDMDDVVTPLPSTQKGYHKYSTEEQVVGEWLDGKPVYEKTITFNTSQTFTFDSNWHKICDTPSTSLDEFIGIKLMNSMGVAGYSKGIVSLPNVIYDDVQQIIKAWIETSKTSSFNYVVYDRVVIQYTKTTD